MRPWRPLGNWLAACCAALFCLTAAAEPATLTGTDAPLRDIAGSVDVLEDPGGRLTLAEVQSAGAAWHPPAPGQAALQFGFTSSAIWLRFELRNETLQPQLRILEIDFPLLSEVTLHVPAEDMPDGYAALHAGRAHPFAERSYPSRLPTFRLDVPAGASSTLYLRVASTGPVNVPLRLWLPAAHQAKERNDYSAQAWYFGVATAMILFNLFLLVALRDPVYFYYVVFVTIGVVSLGAQNNIAHEFLWPGASAWNNVSQLAGFSASLASLLLFMRAMLATRRAVPRLDRVLLLLLWSNAGLALSIGLAGWPSARLANINFLATMAFVVVASIACALRRERAAYFFIAAFATLMGGVLATVLRNFGLLPDNAFTLYSLQLGSILEMLLLALALADRFRVMRRAVDESRTAAMCAQQALVASLQSTERELENRVAERTAASRESQKKLQEIVDTALDAVVRIDARNVIVGWNRQAEQIFGLTADEALGRTLSDTVIPARYRSAHAAGLARFMATREPRVINRRIELTAIDATGREFPIELAITRVSLEDPDAFEFCAFIRDISTRKQAEAEVRLSLDKQTELNNLKARFVTMASHEFRTPLASILSSTELLEHYGERMPAAERAALFGTVSEGVRRMTRMLEDVLIIGRSDVDRLEFDPAPVALPQFIQATVNAVQSGIGARDNMPEIVIEIAEDAHEGILDERLIGHIVANLVSNAIKYSPAGGRITLSIARTGSDLVLTVADQGIGIPEADVPRLFESFSRASNVGTIQGTGLGLAIVKRSVAAHGGRIGVHSTPGQGTRFIVSLPQPA